jgi:hypothetical protein
MFKGYSVWILAETATELLGFLLVFSPYRNIGTSYRLYDGGTGVGVLVRSPYRPDRLRSPPSLLSKEYWELFPIDKPSGE